MLPCKLTFLLKCAHRYRRSQFKQNKSHEVMHRETSNIASNPTFGSYVYKEPLQGDTSVQSMAMPISSNEDQEGVERQSTEDVSAF